MFFWASCTAGKPCKSPPEGRLAPSSGRRKGGDKPPDCKAPFRSYHGPTGWQTQQCRVELENLVSPPLLNAKWLEMSTPQPAPGCPDPVRRWLAEAVQAGASDLHVVVDHPPVLRVHGLLRPLQGDPLHGDTVRGLLTPLCPQQAIARFRAEKNVDFALELTLDDRRQRFRANYFLSGQKMGACFRVIPAVIPDFQWAGFPEALAQRLAHFRNGLVLVSGVAGSGKTTSLAMIINLLNREGGYRIITVEEPVEYLFPKRQHSVITQREVGLDVHAFADGLKYALRQDPDVILVGEIRDRETAQMALSAAETGHLVFSTLHTRDAKGAVSRYTDLFPQSVQRCNS